MSLSQKGFTIPMVVLFVLVFFAAPLIFWYATVDKNSSATVRGAKAEQTKNGFYVQVISKAGTWELSQYLCKTLAECTLGLESGKKWESVSGGATEGSAIKITDDSVLKEYSYVKVFVKPGWGVSSGGFSLKEPATIDGSTSQELDGTHVFVVPTTVFADQTYYFVVFTD